MARHAEILNMLHWLDRYYIGEGVSKNVQLQARINAGKAVQGIWLITLSNNPDNLMEIIPAAMLVQRSAYDSCPTIIGMAKGKDEAIQLVEKIIKTMYRKTGGFGIREFLSDRA